jgi:hypothetical protein
MAAFGKYEVIALIGQGGFGRVYKAYDAALKRHVAVKTCTLQDPEMKQRFAREAEIAANLRHPYIVTVYDYGHESGEPYLVQEYLEGEDLDQKLKRGDVVETVQLVLWLRQTAEGLEYAHGQGVLHRDVKPANIRILPDGTVRIMDFGIAKLLETDRQLTRTGMSIGTSGYLAPETLAGGAVDHRADIFSFGVMAYEMIARRRPFDAESFTGVLYRIVHDDPAPLATVAPDCDPRLVAIVERCLRKDPDERYANFGDVAADLLAPGATSQSAGLAPTGAASAAVAATAQRTAGVHRAAHDAVNAGPAAADPLTAAGPTRSRRVPPAAWAAAAAAAAIAASVAAFGVLDSARPGSGEPAHAVDAAADREPGADETAAAGDPNRDAGAALIVSSNPEFPPAPPSTATVADGSSATAAPVPNLPVASHSAPMALDRNRVVVLVGGAVRDVTAAAETVILDELRSAGFDVRDARLAASAASSHASGITRAGRDADAGYVILAEISASARPIVAGMFSGSATVVLKMYDTAGDALLASDRFEIGTAQSPAEPGPTELAAATAAVRAAAYQAARAVVRRLRG